MGWARSGSMAASAALAVAAACLSVLPAVAQPSPRPSHSASDPTAVYIVVLRSQPLAAFVGDASFARTAPLPGHRFNAHRASVVAYADRLAEGQADVIAALGGPEVVYSYTTALDGFAARLTPEQAKLAQGNAQVASVDLDQVAHLDGAPARSLSAATAAPGPTPGRAAGRGVVIGVVDSGVWPENPSFAAAPLGAAKRHALYPGFTGSCEDAGESWSASLCNAKVIAARSYVRAFGESDVSAAEYLSPRDGSGHGSHVAATAAGDSDIEARIDGQDFGAVSGAAPGAALAVYKACWSAPDPDDDGCATADVAAAVDQAVRDGVDILNYSASSANAGIDDPLATAFRNAATAGVFVATSAGDDGPRLGTVASSAPWVTTVAATARPTFQGGVVLGDGRRVIGSMVSDQSVPPTRLVYGGDVAADGVGTRRARLCEPGSLDAARVEGAIVLCERGATSRVSKSTVVDQVGGVAMVLANTSAGPTDTDVHAVPTVQVGRADGDAIHRYLEHADHPTASLDPSAHRADRRAEVAGFSGRGPTTADAGGILKPDVAAPGTGVVAAVAPPFNFGRLWDVYSGTSMAAPQVAGLAATLASAHPRWSPAALKSAMSTTARPVGSPFAAGSGEIARSAATDPGIVYDADRRDWARFAAGRAPDVNAASIAVPSLTGRTTVPRRVTNVSGVAETYTAAVSRLPGIAARVTPHQLRLRPGQTARFHLTLTAQRAARYGEFVTGRLTWTGSEGHVATSPIAVRATAVAPPAEVHGYGSAGQTSVRARAGVTGTLRTRVVAPVAATATQLQLLPGGFDPAAPQQSAATATRSFYVSPGSFAARFEVDLAAGGDIDMYVYRDGRPVAQATSGRADEQLTIRHPGSGVYTVYLTAPETGTSSLVTARFTGWVLSADPAEGVSSSGIAVNPTAAHVTGSEPVDLQVRWSGLSPRQRWLGAIRYAGSSDVTFVTIN